MHGLCKNSKWESFSTPDCRVPFVAEVFCTNNDGCKRIFVCWDFGARALITSWPGGWLTGKDPVFALQPAGPDEKNKRWPMLGIKTWHVSTRMFLKDARNMDGLGSASHASLMMIAWQAACHAVKCHVTTAVFLCNWAVVMRSRCMAVEFEGFESEKAADCRCVANQVGEEDWLDRVRRKRRRHKRGVDMR